MRIRLALRRYRVGGEPCGCGYGDEMHPLKSQISSRCGRASGVFPRRRVAAHLHGVRDSLHAGGESGLTGDVSSIAAEPVGDVCEWPVHSGSACG